MDKIQLWVDHLLETFGLVGDSVAYISHAVLAMIAILLAVVAGLLCRRILVPIVLRLTKKRLLFCLPLWQVCCVVGYWCPLSCA